MNKVDMINAESANQRILITGAHGFIGFQLAKILQPNSKIIFLVDIVPAHELDLECKDFLKNPNVKYIEADLSREAECNLLPDVDIVYHLAALNGTQNFYEKPFDVLKNSSIPTLYLLERFRSAGKFVYAGSSESYAGGVNMGAVEVPTGENVPHIIEDIANPRWSYACAKTFGEVACMNAYSQFGTKVLIVRFHNVYGPRMGKNHVIPDFIKRALKNSYVLFGAFNTRSFIYSEDAAYDLIDLTKKSTFPNVFNIGGGIEVSMLEIAKIILELLGKSDCKIDIKSAPKGSVLRRLPDLQRIDQLLGERPRVNLTEGLKKTVEWYKSHSQEYL